MKLNRVRIKDFLIISDVDIELDPKYNLFIGKNHEGKTSILKAIEMTLKGSTDPSVIKTGAEEARLGVDTNDGLSIDRVIGKKGQRVRSKKKDKTVDTTNQGYITGLLGDFSFNPIKFVQQDNKGARKKYLTELFSPKVGKDILSFVEPELLARVDFNQDGLSILKNLENIYYERRSAVNKLVKQKEGAYQEMLPKDYDPTVPAPYDIFALDKEMLEIDGALQKIDRDKQTKEANERIRGTITKKVVELQEILDSIDVEKIALLPALTKEIAEQRAKIADLEQKVIEAQATLTSTQKLHVDAALLKSVQEDTLKAIKEQEESLEQFPLPEIKDAEPYLTRREAIGTSIEASKVVARKREQYEKAQAVKQEFVTQEVESERLTVIIEKLRKDLPAQILKDANIPIEGLSFDGDRVFIGGVSMDNMSTQEQVAVAVNIVRKMNEGATIKTLCIDGAETLDWESLEAFRQEIKDDEFQYCLAYVQHGPADIPEGAIFVRDGKVFYNRPEKKENEEGQQS